MAETDTLDPQAAAPADKPLTLAEAVLGGVKGAAVAIGASGELDGASKAAVVLLTVNPEEAADVLRQLSPHEVQRLSARMASVRALSRDRAIEVLREFKEITINNAQVSFDTDAFMQNMLHKALGTEAASDLLGKLEAAVDMTGIETLKKMEPDVLFETIKNEHPQIIATVLVFLEAQQAAAIARMFAPDLRNELMLRVAMLEKVQPSALKELNEVMLQAGSLGADRRTTVGGVQPTAEILNFLSGGADQAALAEIRKFDEALADLIVEHMFTFEDLVEIDDRAMQTLLLEVGQDMLVIALKGASPKLKEKIFSNMARRAAAGVREDLESRGPAKIQDVEDQQKEILKIARGLEAEGRLTLERGAKSDVFI